MFIGLYLAYVITPEYPELILQKFQYYLYGYLVIFVSLYGSTSFLPSKSLISSLELLGSCIELFDINEELLGIDEELFDIDEEFFDIDEENNLF